MEGSIPGILQEVRLLLKEDHSRLQTFEKFYGSANIETFRLTDV